MRGAGWSEVQRAIHGRPRRAAGRGAGSGRIGALDRARALAAGLALGGLLLTACGGDAVGGTEPRADDPGGGAERHRPGAEPEATDPGAVVPYIEELLARHDKAVDQLNADPERAADHDDQVVEEYVHLYEPGSAFAGQALDAWVAQADEGIAIHPYDEGHPATRTRIDGQIEVVGPDEVRVPVCVEQRHLTYQDGALAEGVPLLERQGEMLAVRVDGQWRLRVSDVFTDRSGCRAGDAGGEGGAGGAGGADDGAADGEGTAS